MLNHVLRRSLPLPLPSSSTSLLRRSLATIPNRLVSTDGAPASLHLKTGESFHGRSFGSPTSSFGEAVFSTSITSYTESMTDPSYRGQILVFTTPMIGNYGVPANIGPSDGSAPDVLLESNRVQCAGVVVADVAERYSHYQAVESISQWCERYGVPGITGVDTRAITTILRNQGTTLAQLKVGQGAEVAPSDGEYWDPALENMAAKASTKAPFDLNTKGDVRIALLDFGAKANIARALVSRGAHVTVLPWDTDFLSIADQFDGLFLSNGPGDPRHCKVAVENMRATMVQWKNPIFGICMGNQIMGLAAGIPAYRMRYGNRGHNQPIISLAESGSIRKGRVYVTSQNHQYALEMSENWPEGWEPFFVNMNDGSVEGIKSTKESGKYRVSLQSHPEARGGPLDTMELFDDFVRECRAAKAAKA